MLRASPVSRGAGVRAKRSRSMAAYSGMKSRTSCPRPCRYLVSAAATSARPPVLANGATSEAMAQILTISTRIPVALQPLVMGALVLATTVADRPDPGGDLRGLDRRRHGGGQLAPLLPAVAPDRGLAARLSIGGGGY